jgi:hypothetical protein
MQWATAPAVCMEHGMMAMPSVRNEPLAMLAPMSVMGWTTAAMALTSLTAQSVSSTIVRSAAFEHTRWTSMSGRSRRIWRNRIP